MPRTFFLAILLFCLTFSSSASAQNVITSHIANLIDRLDGKRGRPDTHAPAGLGADHVHKQGKMMLEHKYMYMYMDGMRHGDARVGDIASLSATPVVFTITPTRMTMEMDMFHFMYGLNDNVTLYILPMWFENRMAHRNGSGAVMFNTRNTGFGDLPFGALINLYEDDQHELMFNFGWSAPTGSTTRRTGTPLGVAEFPYPMRLGSGVVNARPGITYKRFFERASLGLQMQSDLPVVKHGGYRDSKKHEVNFWVSHLLDSQDRFAATLRVQSAWKTNISGFDPQLGAAPTLVSTARNDMRGSSRINLGYGLIWALPRGGRINVELVHPVYQHMSGVQLETDLTVFSSYSKAL